MDEPAHQRWSVKRFVWVQSRSRGPISLTDEKYEPGDEMSRFSRERPSRKLLNIAKWLAFSACGFYLVSSRLISNTTPTTEPVHVSAPVLCLEPECIHAASEILYNLDPHYEDIDPCDDFEQYACGGWRDRHDMRPDQGSIFAGTIMAENAQVQLRHILEAPDTSEGDKLSPADKKSFQKLKSAYDSCTDTETLKGRGSKPLNDLLDQIEIIYPVHGKHSKTNLSDVVAFLAQSGVSALTELSVSPDDRDPDSVVVFVTPPRQIGLPAREYYNNTQTVKDYTGVVLSVLHQFESSKGDGLSSLRLAKNVVLLEQKLANATPDTQAQEDVTQYYNPKSPEEAEALVPEISFSKIISKLGPKGYQAKKLIVGSPSYLEELSAILSKTPRVVVQAFFKWKVIQTFADEIEDAKIAPLLEFNNRLAGKDPRATEERWRKCIQTLDFGIGWTLSRFYVLDSFSEASKELGDQIVSDIKERFVYILDQTKWMSPEVRQLGKQKVANIIQKIGYPTKSPNLMDDDDVNNYYADLHIANDTFFENVVSMTRFEVKRQWAKLGKPTDRDEWGMSAPTVNAYYNPPGNEIVFPAGIMQPPTFYGPNAPLYLAYGAFGAVSGHELSHAFDSGGRHYDQIGNYTDWWNNKTVEAFEDRAQCFIDQYSNYTVPGPDPDSEPLHVNGRLTLGENIADAGGLSASYFAWKKHDDSRPDKSLPGLTHFTKDQLFFVSYSNWWCSKTTKAQAVRAIYTDPHAPKPARVLETLANSREFKEAFKCPTKEPLQGGWGVSVRMYLYVRLNPLLADVISKILQAFSELARFNIQHSASTTMTLQFIDSGGPDGIRKLEGHQRKLIRSYVMKGRNLNKTIRRGKCNQQECALQNTAQPTPTFNEKQSQYRITSIPRRVGDEFSGFQFAFELEPYMKRAMYNFLTSLSEHIYPMQVCLPRDPTDDVWFFYTLVEPAYLHCLLALSISMIECLSLNPQNAQPDALFHLGEALRLISETLKCFQQERLPDPLFAVITSLAIADSCEGNTSRARIHLDGLQCMLEHVGGFSYLNHNPSLQLKMLRLDVEFSVRTKSRPRFYYDAIDSPLATISFNRQPSPYPDLESTFNCLTEFTANFRNQQSNPVYLHPNTFHATISSLNYRLLSVTPSRGLQEALRLASLAFMTSWFGYGFRMRYELLGSQLLNSLLGLGDLGAEKFPLILWMVFVGAIAIFSDREFDDISPILVRTLGALNFREWSDVQGVLTKFPWVACLHERAAHRIWQKVSVAD